jgi:hypothetical protein
MRFYIVSLGLVLAVAACSSHEPQIAPPTARSASPPPIVPLVAEEEASVKAGDRLSDDQYRKGDRRR